MKLKFVIITTSFIPSILFSQPSFELRDNLGNLLNNDTLFLYGTVASSSLILDYVDVYNVSTSTKNVKVTKIEVAVVAGSDNTFDWDTSYPPFVYTSSGTVSISPVTPYTLFAGDYFPNGFAGTTTVRYVFFDNANPSDSAWLLVNYVISPSGIDDASSSGIISQPFPNPFSETTTFLINGNYTDAKLELFDIAGRMLMEIPANRNQVIVRGNLLAAGIYSWKIISKERMLGSGKIAVE